MEKDFIIEAESEKEPEKREQIRLSEEKIADLKRIIANLGSDIDELSLQKDLLIVENNKLRGLLRECEAWMSWAYAELYEYDPEHESKNTEDLLTRINAALSESEGK